MVKQETRKPVKVATSGLVLEAMSDVEPQTAGGALVSVAALRYYLGDPLSFDDTVLALADAGAISLHHADHPWDAPEGITDHDRTDHAGRPMRVIGIALR
jgi:hypothetical protein